MGGDHQYVSSTHITLEHSYHSHWIVPRGLLVTMPYKDPEKAREAHHLLAFTRPT
jgi:hypothetical protein